MNGIDRAVHYLLTERRIWRVKAVESHTKDHRSHWTLWNDATWTCQVWIASDMVTFTDIEYLEALVNEIEHAHNDAPVSTVTGMDLPTKGEINPVEYVGVIVTSTLPPLPALMRAESQGIFILYQRKWLGLAELELTMLDEIDAQEAAKRS